VSVREEAARILARFEARGTFLGPQVAGAVQSGRVPAEGRAVLTELCAGTLRRRGTLRVVEAAYLTARLDPQPLLRAILDAGLYQLLYLDTAPAAAVVSDAVTHARTAIHRGAGNLVNAVLRNALRGLRKEPARSSGADARATLDRGDGTWLVFDRPVLPEDPLEQLAARYSHPVELVRRWGARMDGGALEAALRAGNERPPLVLRANRLKGTPEEVAERLRSEGVETAPGAHPEALEVRGAGGDLLRSKAFAEGLFYVQDATPMRAARLLDPRKGEKVLDLCAAPGGKATHLVELMENTGEVMAVDRSEEGVGRIRENGLRLGAKVLLPVVADGRELPPQSLERFDRVLLDAPCSNTGVFRRRPEARWRFREEELASLVALQAELLEAALGCVKPGGTLVYSTCSIEPEENRGQVERLRERHPEVAVVSDEVVLPRPGGPDGGGFALLRKEGAATG
jgi:16S rRNA (cytosine967-C5)-methyltransferase